MNRSAFLALALLLPPGCLVTRVLGRVLSEPHEPRRVEHKVVQPVRSDARLSVLWVGHSTVLIQMDDRFVLTDPVLTRMVGGFSPRLFEPGIDPAHLPPRMVVAVSHLHLDHLSYDSLDLLEDKIQVLLLPLESRQNLPRYAFETQELKRWQTYDQNGLRVTAVPVRHVGGRWQLDNAWNKRSYTGFVFEYHGLSVYFGGDTVFAPAEFRATQRKFRSLDLALLPICPIEPQRMMQYAHMDPGQALDALAILGAKFMVPIHFDTFINGDDRLGECSLRLRGEMSHRDLGEDRVAILTIGEQRVLLKK